eukprot:TRINITY_DN12605_c0_g1_i1.p2 TRINITY_DN12605_c0_g1~~TRINITY_DN12605_c0_g1_i1.p2  ORF type:complete len:106 (+),score=3.71 TRINITY_DN12605_c0_g1_i1:250-567(+)
MSIFQDSTARRQHLFLNSNKLSIGPGYKQHVLSHFMATCMLCRVQLSHGAWCVRRACPRAITNVAGGYVAVTPSATIMPSSKIPPAVFVLFSRKLIIPSLNNTRR